MPKTADPDFLTNEDLAGRWRVPLSTVRRWRHEGTGPAGIRLGNHVRYPRAEVERWEAEQAAADRVAARIGA